MGAMIGMYLSDFSINQLTLFGMVLAIGIVVDDAIVVIESVERIMREEHLPPKEATRKAMSQITNPIIAISLVLAAVFIPSALQSGSVGRHLSAVRPHHRDLDGVLRVPRAVADAGAVRDDAAARAHEGKHRLPLVQPRIRQGAGILPAIGEVLAAPSALVAGGFRRAAAHRRPAVLARAQQLRARGRSGFCARPGADAGRHRPCRARASS